MTNIPHNAHITDVSCPACGEFLYVYEAMIGAPRTAVLDCFNEACCMRSGRLTISPTQYAAMTAEQIAERVAQAKASWR